MEPRAGPSPPKPHLWWSVLALLATVWWYGPLHWWTVKLDLGFGAEKCICSKFFFPPTHGIWKFWAWDWTCTTAVTQATTMTMLVLNPLCRKRTPCSSSNRRGWGWASRGDTFGRRTLSYPSSITAPSHLSLTVWHLHLEKHSTTWTEHLTLVRVDVSWWVSGLKV